MIRTETIEIDGKQYIIRPLPGKYIGKMFTILKQFSKIKENSSPEEIIGNLDGDTMTILHELATVSLNNAKTGMSNETLDEYVTQNLMGLIQPILKVNMPQSK